MSQKAIRAIYESRLKAWAANRTPALPVAFQNAAFTKPSSGAYLRAFMLPNDTDSRFLEATDRVYRGYFQVSLVCSLNGGPALAEDIAAELVDLFPQSLDLYSAFPIKTTIMAPMSQAPAQQEPDAYVVPMSFPYHAQVIEDLNPATIITILSFSQENPTRCTASEEDCQKLVNGDALQALQFTPSMPNYEGRKATVANLSTTTFQLQAVNFSATNTSGYSALAKLVE